MARLLTFVVFPAAGQGQHLASCPGGLAARLRPALHAVQRAAAPLPPRAFRPRRLVHHLHDRLLLLQRIPGQSLHVLRPQVSGPPTPHPTSFSSFNARFHPRRPSLRLQEGTATRGGDGRSHHGLLPVPGFGPGSCRLVRLPGPGLKCGSFLFYLVKSHFLRLFHPHAIYTNKGLKKGSDERFC